MASAGVPHRTLKRTAERIGRREFVALLGGAAAAWPVAARAQQTQRLRRIGVFVPGSEKTHGQYVKAFQSSLGELGYVEGDNYALKVRWGEGKFSYFRDYAAELVKEKLEVVLATGTSVVSTLKRETQTVPIVFVQVADPVASGFIASLAHPGGNISGFTNYEPAMIGKWLELLKEIAPRLTRVVLVYNPQAASASGTNFLHVFEAAAAALSVKPIAAPFHDLTEIESAIAELGRGQGGGFVVVPDGTTLTNLNFLLALEARNRVPAIYPFREFATGGGLAAYGASIIDQYRRAASYVDRILKGEKPADLPVQAPTNYELVINLKTAKALGLDVPSMLLARADEVIE